MQFAVHATTTYTPDFKSRVPAYKAVGYIGAGANFPVESMVTTDKAEAEDWAARATAGEEVPEARFGSFADD